MVLDKYKSIIDEIVVGKNNEKDPEKKKGWIDFEQNIRKLDRATEIQDRIKFLCRQNRLIECLCFLSQWIEIKLKEFIKSYIDLSLLLNENIEIDKNWEEKPLGGLIFIMKGFLNNNDLFEKLKEFNNLRVKSLHKIFDVNFQISEVEGEISLYLKNNDYYENIVNPIQRYSTTMVKEVFDKNANIKPVPKESELVILALLKKMKEIDPLLDLDNLKKDIKINFK